MHRIIALHGFLGMPRDFAALNLDNLYAPNLFAIAPRQITSWIKQFNRACPDDAVLLGYSMGGRIALHAALDAPQKYRAAIIIAAHPGLVGANARASRRASDALWAERLRSLPWDEFMSSWNQQPVLQSSLPRPCLEDNFSRASLAHYLRSFSLGEQAHLTPRINQLAMPILWLAHRNEASALDGLSLKHAASQLHFVAEGGHRFIFQHPEIVTAHINNFLRSL